MKPLIEFNNVCKYYQMGDTTVTAADHISFQISQGEFVAIVGQSGSEIHVHEYHRLSGCSQRRNVFAGWAKRRRDEKNELADIRNNMLGFIFQQYNLLSS